eukprot:snap_masked-scaffold_6-processed-gene-13.38-mRNA-1 protein AED:1.00 eAED:1.00 QI:0/-1/0/0/-1/1/1/0/261
MLAFSIPLFQKHSLHALRNPSAVSSYLTNNLSGPLLSSSTTYSKRRSSLTGINSHLRKSSTLTVNSAACSAEMFSGKRILNIFDGFETQKRFVRALVVVGTSFATADALSQMIQLRSSHSGMTFKEIVSHVDLERSLTMFCIGSTITGPVSQTFQILLEKMIPGKGGVQITKKIGISLMYALIVSIPLVLASTTIVLRKGTLEDAKRKIKESLLDTFQVGAMYWPVVNVFVFKFISMHSRAMVLTSFGGLWNVYLSSVANN